MIINNLMTIPILYHVWQPDPRIFINILYLHMVDNLTLAIRGTVTAPAGWEEKTLVTLAKMYIQVS